MSSPGWKPPTSIQSERTGSWYMVHEASRVRGPWLDPGAISGCGKKRALAAPCYSAVRDRHAQSLRASADFAGIRGRYIPPSNPHMCSSSLEVKRPPIYPFLLGSEGVLDRKLMLELIPADLVDLMSICTYEIDWMPSTETRKTSINANVCT